MDTFQKRSVFYPTSHVLLAKPFNSEFTMVVKWRKRSIPHKVKIKKHSVERIR